MEATMESLDPATEPMCEPQERDPNVDVKPKVTVDMVPDLVWRLYGLKVLEVKSLPSYSDLNFYIHVGNEVENEHINVVSPDGYVLKILNSFQSTHQLHIEANHAMIRYVQERGIPTQTLQLNKEGNDYSLEKVTDANNDVHGPYICRLSSFCPGKIFFQTPYIAGSFQNVGQFLGKLHHVLKDFEHPFYGTFKSNWSLVDVPGLRNFLHAVEDNKDRAMVAEVIDDFEKNVVPEFENFRKGSIHGDVNDRNLVMRPVQSDIIDPSECVHDVAAILDFEDSERSYPVMDVAIAIARMTIECPVDTQLEVGGHILSGYNKYSSLNEAEKKWLKTLVCGRLCTSLVLGAHAYSLNPGNDYVLKTKKKGWPLLHRLWGEDRDALYARWDKLIASA